MIEKLKSLKFNLNGSFAAVAVMNGFSSLVRIFTSFITTKIVASIIGPSGIALIGQLSNFLSFIFAFSSGGINGGIVKYTAENKNHPNLLKYYLSTSMWITFTFSTIIGIGILLTTDFLSKWILYSNQYSIVFYFIAGTISFYAFNSVFLSIVNGLKDFKKYTYINIISSLLTLSITVALVLAFKVKGALVALIISQSTVIVITLFFIRRDHWFRIKVLFSFFKWKVATKLFKYSIMAVTTALFVPATQFLIRSYVITNFSIESAGIWEGMNKVSNMYLVVVTTTLGIYFLPKFSETQKESQLRLEILKAYKFVVPALIVGCFIIYLSRVLLIKIVFTPEFLPMKDLFVYQLLGDITKIMTWILGTVMVSKAMYKEYVALEIITNVLLYLLSTKFSEVLGLKGLCVGYFLSLLITLVLMVILFRKLLFSKETELTTK